MHKNATKCNKTLRKWYKNKHGASKIIDTFETYHSTYFVIGGRTRCSTTAMNSRNSAQDFEGERRGKQRGVVEVGEGAAAGL
jgi:hypothetical protein